MSHGLSTPRNELILAGELLVLLVSLPLIMLLVVLSRPLYIIAGLVCIVSGAVRNALRRSS